MDRFRRHAAVRASHQRRRSLRAHHRPESNECGQMESRPPRRAVPYARRTKKTRAAVGLATNTEETTMIDQAELRNRIEPIHLSLFVASEEYRALLSAT